MADPDAMYILNGKATIIALSTYIDMLVSRPDIIADDMPYVYFIPLGEVWNLVGIEAHYLLQGFVKPRD